MRSQVLLILAAATLVGVIGIYYLQKSPVPRPELRKDGPPPMVKVSMPVSQMQPGDEALILELHDAGLQHNEAALTKLIKALDSSTDEVRLTALWALARLGNQDALPAVQKMADDARTSYLTDVRPYAQVVAAQLQSIQPEPARDPTHLGQQMQSLLHAAALSVDTANRTLLMSPQAADQSTLSLTKWTMLQLADIALVASKRGMAQPAKVSPLDLSLRPAAKVKAELSAHPPQQHVQYLVQTLANKRNLSSNEDYLIQCLANEGAPARPAIIARLNAMRQEPPGSYTNAAPLALFRALEGIGGTPDSAAAVGTFRNHPDRYIRSYAEETYRFLSGGGRRFRVIAY